MPLFTRPDGSVKWKRERGSTPAPVATTEHAGLMSAEDKTLLSQMNPLLTEQVESMRTDLETQLAKKIDSAAAMSVAQSLQRTIGTTQQNLTNTAQTLASTNERIDLNLKRIDTLEVVTVPTLTAQIASTDNQLELAAGRVTDLESRAGAIETRVAANENKLGTIEPGAQVVTRPRVNEHIDRVPFGVTTVAILPADAVMLPIAPDTLYMVTAKVAARDALLGAHAIWNMTARAWRVGTGNAQLAIGLNTKDSSSGTNVWSTSFVVNGNNLILRVSGPALLVKWAGYLEFVKV